MGGGFAGRAAEAGIGAGVKLEAAAARGEGESHESGPAQAAKVRTSGEGM